MLDFLNPTTRTDSEMEEIVKNLGSFYHMMDDDSKVLLRDYFKGLITGLEGVYYNIVESTESYDLNGNLPWIDLSYNSIALNYSDAETKRLAVPVLSSAVFAGTPGSVGFSYVVSSVDYDGNETPASTSIKVDNCTNTLGSGGSVTLTWEEVSNATSYNVYGRQVGDYRLLGNTANLTWVDDDSGYAALPNDEPPALNTTIEGFIITLPESFNGYSMLTITSIGDRNLETDYSMYSGNKIMLDPDIFGTDFNEIGVAVGAYAFTPILLKIYMAGLTNSDDYMQIIQDEAYPSYLDIAQVTGSTTVEKTKKAWAFHLNKLFHNLSLLTRRALSITNLENILKLIYNYPFAYDAGTVSAITNSGGYNTFTIGDYYYKVPNTLNLGISQSDTVDKYELLIDSGEIEIRDAYTTSTASSSGVFGANKDVEIITTTSTHTGHQLMVDSFYNNILPDNLKVTITVI